MSNKEQMECYNSGWQDGYVEAIDRVLDMLSSVGETPQIYKIKESLRKIIEKGED